MKGPFIGPFASGSVSFAPIVSTPRRLRANWSASGSTSVYGPDRTGDLVRAGAGEVYIVRDSVHDSHKCVNEHGQEVWLKEEDFWPWGSWEKLA